MGNNLVESLSEKQHEIWAGWMKYVFTQCIEETNRFDGSETGNLIIPKSKVKRWKRQIHTEYRNLSEKEKQSDREQVYKFQHLINES